MFQGVLESCLLIHEDFANTFVHNVMCLLIVALFVALLKRSDLHGNCFRKKKMVLVFFKNCIANTAI